MIGMSLKPSTDIDMIDPSSPSAQDLLPIDDGLPEISNIGTSSGLGANQYRTSDGIVHRIDPIKFKELLSGESDRIISGIIKNPNVEYGQGLADIIESEALGRSSTLADPESIKVGNKDVYISPDERGELMLKFGVDFAKEGTEGIFNTLRKIVSPEMIGVFKGRDAAKKARDEGRGEYLNIFDTPLSGQGSIADNLKEISEYSSTGGEKVSTLDNIVLEASTGEIDQSLEEIAAAEAKPIEQKAKEKDAGDGTKEVAGKKTEDAKKAGASTDPTYNELTDNDTLFDTEEEDEIPGITPGTPNDEAEQLLTIFDRVGGFINSDANMRMMRNVGKSLTQYGNLSQGIGIGSAAASEERVLEEQLEKQRQAKITEELIKAGKGVSLKPSDVKGLSDLTNTLNEDIKLFEGSEASIAIMNDAIALFEDAVAKGVPVTGLFGKIEQWKDQGKAFFDIGSGKVSDATKIQNYIDQVKQRSIRDILNESGRTISDLDRDIVDKVFGELNFTDDPGEILEKLTNARMSLVQGNKSKRNTINTNYNLIIDPSYGETGTNAIKDYKELITKIINTPDYSFDTPIIYGNKDFSSSSAGIFIDAS